MRKDVGVDAGTSVLRDAACPASRTPSPHPRGTDPIPWGSLWRQACVIWFAARVALAGVSWPALLFVRARPTSGVVFTPPTHISLSLLLNQWVFWDGRDFLRIAQTNYADITLAVWFPLYPLLIRIVATPLLAAHLGAPVAWPLAALLVSNLATLGAYVALGALIYTESGYLSRVGPGLRVLTVYPFALFLAAAYSDSLFLLVACAALLCARRGAWGWAALWATLAGLTRMTAIILIVPLAWECVTQERRRWPQTLTEWKACGATWWGRLWRVSRAHFARVGAVLAAPAGIGCYLLYSQVRWHDWLAATHEEAQYERVLRWPWHVIPALARAFAHNPMGGYAQAHVLLDVAPLVLACALTALGWRRWPVSWRLYLVGLLLLCVCTPLNLAASQAQYSPFWSLGRYLLAAFPLATQLGAWTMRRPWLDQLLLFGGWGVQVVLVCAALTGGWVI